MQSSFLRQGSMARGFVAIHVGAGFHSDANSKELKALCKKACKEAMECLRRGLSSVEAVSLAISVLEKSCQTNAAMGSNLSLMGTVECDASIMDGHGNFGAVGAVEGVVNPIQVANALLKESAQGSLPLGRVPPLVLVGDGASLWAKQHQLETCSAEDLITDRARAVYLDHVTRLEEVTRDVTLTRSLSESPGDGLLAAMEVRGGGGGGSMSSSLDVEVAVAVSQERGEPCQQKGWRKGCGLGKHPRHKEAQNPVKKKPAAETTCAGPAPSHAPLDTVGAICLDMKGEAAAGVSSGGISLKSPGRVGQATMYGCGCWADNEVREDSRAVAASTSGTGEYIIKTMLAKECAMAMADSSLRTVLDEQFLHSKRLRHVEQKLAGAIAFSLTANNVLHFSWGHTTESMCIGFMAAAHKEPTAIISKMENPERSGLTSHVQALRIRC